MILDIGTGDGRFVYQSAKENPTKFFVGIDPNAKALEKISMKATRRSAKGGLPNLLFIRAAVEDLPTELADTAGEIHVNFPWGSLLKGVATGHPRILCGLRRLSKPRALLRVVIGFDPDRDRRELERLKLADFSLDYVRSTLMSRYAESGWNMKDAGVLEKDVWTRLQTTWARRLSSNDAREVVYFIAEAQK